MHSAQRLTICLVIYPNNYKGIYIKHLFIYIRERYRPVHHPNACVQFTLRTTPLNLIGTIVYFLQYGLNKAMESSSTKGATPHLPCPALPPVLQIWHCNLLSVCWSALLSVIVSRSHNYLDYLESRGGKREEVISTVCLNATQKQSRKQTGEEFCVCQTG